ncbi:MAG TPA: hypothetical protein VFQ35_09290 [Polyangiaceae bacterium]|nr:hypothetical protein [Polyangiaceae bacterium]
MGATRGIWLVALGLLACRARTSPERLPITRAHSIRVPANDPSRSCSDVQDARVCWAAEPGEGLWVGERPLPGPNAADPRKYRCTGVGDQRECRLRADLAPPFRCREERCTQPLPRVPDDGEWECADLGGVVLCRGGGVPAGVARPSSDPGWRCGARRKSSTGERICLDLDPDYPGKRGESFRCHYDYEGAKLTRTCEPSRAPVIGTRCESKGACPADARCIGGICLPASFNPSCWGDLDCSGDERCVYGACAPRSP